MTAFSHVALIGFGEVGRTLGADLLARGLEISVYDILFDDTGSIPSRALATIQLRKARSAVDAVAGAELVISAVTAAADADAARSVAAGLRKGTFFLDLNSVSPGMKKTTAAIIESAGGNYVEAAVMTPIAALRIASSMLLGGPHACAFMERAAPLGFKGEPFSSVIGQASAAKMCRSIIVKGTEALITESMLAARRYGVEKAVLDSLSDLLPVGDWEKLAFYMISRALEHGKRRAEEMREAAETVREAGVEPLMAVATAARQDWSAAHKSALKDGDLIAMLDSLHALMDERSGAPHKAAE